MLARPSTSDKKNLGNEAEAETAREAVTIELCVRMWQDTLLERDEQVRLRLMGSQRVCGPSIEMEDAA
jgi:hypothetical protein